MKEAYRAKARRQDVSWRESEQIVQLIAMANPVTKAERQFPGDLCAMKLTVKPQINEFKEAKEAFLVLAPYARFGRRSDAELFAAAPGNAPTDKIPRAASNSFSAPPTAKPAGPPAQKEQRFGFTKGQRISVGGERGEVVGFEGSKVQVNFGDGPEPIDPDDIDRT